MVFGITPTGSVDDGNLVDSRAISPMSKWCWGVEDSMHCSMIHIIILWHPAHIDKSESVRQPKQQVSPVLWCCSSTQWSACIGHWMKLVINLTLKENGTFFDTASVLRRNGWLKKRYDKIGAVVSFCLSESNAWHSKVLWKRTLFQVGCVQGWTIEANSWIKHL